MYLINFIDGIKRVYISIFIIPLTKSNIEMGDRYWGFLWASYSL